MVNRTDGDRRLRDIVAHAVRTRFTDRLRLEPITGPRWVLPGHAADLVRLYADPWVAHWYDEVVVTEEAAARAAGTQAGWEADRCQQVDRVRAVERRAGRTGRNVPDTAGRGSGRGDRRAGGTGMDGGRLELGWALVESARGRGLATEIGRAGLDFAFGTLRAPDP